MKVFCLLSDKRAFQSRAPSIFSTVMKQIGFKGVYVPFQIEPPMLADAIRSLRVLNIAGANVAVPYKEAVIPHLDILSEGATMVGAVNTITYDGKKLKGYNTNAIGFMDTLEEVGFDPTGKSALVFGTGGVAKAVVFILNWLRTDSILVVGRNVDKALQMADRLGGQGMSLESVAGNSFQADIVVNATTVSTRHESPSTAAIIENLDVSGCELVLDLNYGRSQNIWEELARKTGARFMDGLPTLAYQAKRSFALWTRIQVDPVEFFKALDES